MTIAGIVVGFGLVALAIITGGQAKMFFSIPSFMITVGGSFAAVLVQYSVKDVKNVFRTVKQAFTSNLIDPEELIELFSELAKKARREGLIALEDDTDRLNDPFFSKGIHMVVDAMEPEAIREILEIDILYMTRRHEKGSGIFKTWGNLAPAFGMIGTLVGLIQMLAQLDNPESLGPSMALALITTLYGAMLAYMVFIPLAGKLNLRSEEELMLRQMMLEGIIAIQSGVNPRILEERMRSFMAPRIRTEQKGNSSTDENFQEQM
ncbi:MAG: chemotaxis protein MotA [Clostridia bacterium]|nr:chemotaxis protein MotA [Clostridia bacterium]